MTKSSCLCLFVVLGSFNAHAQKSPIKFGDIPMDQMTMTKYEKDSSAAAVVLADYGESTITYTQSVGFKLNFERLTRIKILSKEGLEWANFEIPLYHSGASDEKILGLKAVTYNLEGGKIVQSKLKSDAVFKEKQDANRDLMKVALPNAKEGSVIEITYRVYSDFLFNFQDWEFQQTIPVVWSEYRASIPEYFFYEKYMQGYVPLTINEQSDKSSSIELTTKERGEGLNPGATAFTQDKIEFIETKFRWVSQDVSAFKPEPYMTTYKDYLSKLNFELSYTKFPNKPPTYYRGTWERLNQEFLDNESFGQLVKGSGFLNKITDEAIAGKNTPEEKMAAIYAMVKDNMEWDGTYRKYATDDLKKPWEKKKGSSAEINLMLASMLQKADIKANPVLISTRDHGFVREQSAISSQFNYVICSVMMDGKNILLDATDRTLPMNILPERCLNGQGYVISKENSGWVKLIPNFKSRTVTSVALELNAEGKLTGKVNFSRDGYDAQEMRKSYLSKGEAGYLKALAGANNWELIKSEFENVKKITEPVKEVHEVTMAEQTQGGGGIIYLNPIITKRLTENPFKAEKREYPVNFGSASEELFMGKIIIPEGFVVDELPKPKLLTLPGNGARYVYSLFIIGNTLSITSQLSINKSLFTQEEYPNLREFYNQVVAKQAEQIVLKKK